jgi:hypothetical protein
MHGRITNDNPRRPLTDDEKARAHAEINARYAKQAKERGKRDHPFRRMARFRLHDLQNLLQGRGVPADGGWEYLTITAHHIAFSAKPTYIVANIIAWARRFTPALPTDDGVRLLAERIAANPRRWSADKLAWRLNLTMAERTAFGITTIGAIDMTKAEREAQRKENRAKANRQRRAAQSTGKPRGRPSKGKPWEALGVSRATYYRRPQWRNDLGDPVRLPGREIQMRGQHSTVTYAGLGISSHVTPCSLTQRSSHFAEGPQRGFQGGIPGSVRFPL